MNTYQKLMSLAYETLREEGNSTQWADIEELAEFSATAKRPEELFQAGEDAVKEGVARGWPALIEAGRLLKKEAQRWGEKRVDALRAREEADRQASKFSLGDALRGAL